MTVGEWVDIWSDQYLGGVKESTVAAYKATKASITQQTHQQMIESGAVVRVSDDVIQTAEQSFPDLRGMKKKDRTPILKDSINKLKSNLRQFLGKLSGQSFEFEVNGKILEAKLYSTGINEVLEKVTKDKASMLYSTDQIFRNARYLYSTPDYDGDTNVYRWNYFYTPVQIGNDTVGVRIAVRDMIKPEESQIYNWGIKKDTPLGGVGHEPNGSTPHDASSGVSNNSIPETVQEVNGNLTSKGNPAPSTPATDTQRQSTEGGQSGIKGTGAAEVDFSGKPAYNAVLSEDNAQADRRGDARPMELPERDINGGNVSAVTGNVYGAGVTPDEFASLMEEPTARGDFSYVPISNNEATQQAMDNITRYGWQDAYTQWSNAVHQGRAGAEMSARGALFLNHAAQAGDRQQWLNILSDFQRLGTNTAQGLQAFRILRNLAPSDRLYMMRRSVAQMVEDMHLNVPIEIDQQLADQYQNAPTNEEADAILDEIIDDVAAQIPSTAADRWTALRYVNMLGNLRTQVRNISGNIGAKFTYLAKDQIGAALEKVAHAFNPDFQRTKSAWVSNELKALGRADFDEVRDIVLENGRFDDARRFDSTYFAREVNERRRIFRNGFMESYRRLTNWAMNNDYFGDAGFARSAYARAFGG